MAKNRILGQSGISLADSYDVGGSKVLIEELESDGVKTVHEMGGTMVSERMSGQIRRATTGAIAQNIVISDVLNLPATFSRIMAIQVITDTVSRLARVSVSIRSSPAGVVQEEPIWIWNGADSQSVDMFDNGTLSIFSVLEPKPETMARFPITAIGTHAAQNAGQLAFRGLTTGFGAGTVFATLIVYSAFTELRGVSSYGLPMPSW